MGVNKWICVTLLMTLSAIVSFGQIGLKPLQCNPAIQSYLKEHPEYQWNQKNKHAKWGTDDTLTIPFFEDFTSTLMYPDSSKWQDNNVYVNRSFGVNPPSYGVATFDYLNSEGLPYTSIEKESIDYGDTLTSQYINLSDSAGISYALGDSFYFSFYYQASGLGDFITENDSIKLLFRDNQGKWNHIWGVNGSDDQQFKQVIIPISNAKYLHTGFQFQFVNLTHRWGNNNHWHLDYIYLNKNRKFNDVFYDDYAIETSPTSLLKNFYELPYDHFLADLTEAADSIYFGVTNRNNAIINAEVRYQELSNGVSLVNTNFADNAGNVPADGFIERKVKSYDLTGLSGYPVVITRDYYVRESGRINSVLFQGNDKLTTTQTFGRHYAYDDGTAESGFGFNDLRSEEGRIVLAFDLKKADTLRAVDFMLTYNTQDVARQRFIFEIYTDIEINGGSDVMVFSKSFVGQDIYDGITNRGFFTIPLDSAIPLEKGTFYVGWSQDQDFNLTVGFDKNNGNIRSKEFNKNIYFNVGDGWIQNSNKALVGAPMIRPIVGAEDPWLASENTVRQNRSLAVYPNPAEGKITITEDIESLTVLNSQGQEVSVYKINESTYDVSRLTSGLYFITITTKQNERLSAKLIKQ